MRVLRFFFGYGRTDRKERKYAARILKAALIKGIGRKYDRNNRPLILSGLPALTDMFHLDVLWKNEPDPDFIEIIEYITEILPELKIKGAARRKFRPRKKIRLIIRKSDEKHPENGEVYGKSDISAGKIPVEIGTITPIIIDDDGTDAADMAVGIKRRIIPPLPEKIPLPEYMYRTSPFITEGIIKLPVDCPDGGRDPIDYRVTFTLDKIEGEKLDKIADLDKLETDSITAVGFKIKTDLDFGKYMRNIPAPQNELKALLTAAEYMLPASAAGDGIPYIKVSENRGTASERGLIPRSSEEPR